MKYWVRSLVTSRPCHTDRYGLCHIDKQAVRRSGMILPGDSIPDRMAISLAGKTGLTKSDLMMLELIAQLPMDDRLYVATTVGKENFMNLSDNFVQEGLAYRITPFNTQRESNISYDHILFDKEKMYHNIMTRFKWGNVSMKGFYMDETVERMCYTHRRMLAELALQFIRTATRWGLSTSSAKPTRSCVTTI